MKNQVSEKEFLTALLRKDFKSFVVKVFNEVSPNAIYSDNWHVDVICNELMNILEGKENRLIINIPPRYMKSIICSIAFPAFILGHNPKASVIAVSYSDELSLKLALDCKKIMEAQWYKEIFPNTRLSKNKKSVNDFETTKGGGRYATSVNGTLTGRGADFIIIDDPIKPMDAMSDLLREKTNDWYGNTLYSRLNDKRTGKIIVIMQRLHENDFTGYLLDTDPNFKHLKIPSIAETDEIWKVKDRIFDKNKTFKRKAGKALQPEREDLEKLQNARKYMGEFSFSGQYQQNPMPKEGGVIKKNWLQFYDRYELFKSIEKGEIEVAGIIQSWDTANKVLEHNDYSVCVTLLRDLNGASYILDVYRNKLEFPYLIRKVAEKYNMDKEKYKYDFCILIEDQASGTSLIQTLQKEHRVYPIAIKPEYDKVTRLIAVSNLIENGTCLFPSDKPHWWADFEQEILRFPRVKHDDQCDALSQALQYEISPPLYIYSRNRREISKLTENYGEIDWSGYY